MAQVVESLPTKHEALSSDPSTTKKNHIPHIINDYVDIDVKNKISFKRITKNIRNV